MYDPNENIIKPVTPEEVPERLAQGWQGPFQVGEMLPWKKVWFRVDEICSDAIILRPVKINP